MRSVAVGILWIALLAFPAFSAECQQASVSVCFRPGPESCVDRIAAAIGSAKRSVLIQAYGFSSTPIAKALLEAKKRGVAVRAVLDESNRTAKYSAATFLANAGIPVRIDEKVAIAHNKVIVVDDELVIGGSYNFTKSAEERNAENVSFTKSPCVARLYTENFERRWDLSEPYRRPAESR